MYRYPIILIQYAPPTRVCVPPSRVCPPVFRTWDSLATKHPTPARKPSRPRPPGGRSNATSDRGALFLPHCTACLPPLLPFPETACGSAAPLPYAPSPDRPLCPSALCFALLSRLIVASTSSQEALVCRRSGALVGLVCWPCNVAMSATWKTWPYWPFKTSRQKRTAVVHVAW